MTEEETTITQTEDKKSTRTKKQYVLPHERGWQVKLEGSSKATKVFKTKAEAGCTPNSSPRTRTQPSCVRRRTVRSRRKSERAERE